MMFGMNPSNELRPCWMLSANCTLANTRLLWTCDDGSTQDDDGQKATRRGRTGGRVSWWPDARLPRYPGRRPDNVSRFATAPDVTVTEQLPSRRARSDVAMNRKHIVGVASDLLSREPRASMSEVARCRERQPRDALPALPVARGPPRGGQPSTPATTPRSTTSEDRLRPAGELARATPTPLSVADVLNKVPPHLLGDQIVAEAQRLAGVSSAAVYLVDLEGAGSAPGRRRRASPRRSRRRWRSGTEIPREGLARAGGHASTSTLPGAVSAPLLLRGRALGRARRGRQRRRRPRGPRVRGGGRALARGGLHRPPRRRPPRARDQPGGRDPAEPAAAEDRAHRTARSSPATSCPATRSAATGSTTPRTPPGRGSGSPTRRGAGRGRPRWRPSRSARSAPGVTSRWTCPR